jgi:cardiolipin synthase (CMP-forming)
MSFTIPNLLSLFRMGLVPFFIIAVLEGQATRALLLFAAAGVTDALDGAIARFFNQRSALGAYLDPIADKLLLTSAYVVLAFPGVGEVMRIPAWVSVLVIARDVLLVTVALILYLALGVKRFPPSLLSKLTTLTQVAAVVLVLASGSFRDVEEVATGVVYLAAALTIASGLDYVLRSNRLVGDKTGDKAGEKSAG